MAEDSTADKVWDGRPGIARLIRFVVLASPILAAIGLTRLVVTVLPRPSGWGPNILWWALVLTTSVSTGAVMDKWSRRFLPVATLMKLSLVFPDEAPSRFKVALRRDSIRDLERRLREDAIDPTSTPNDAARILVEMVAQLSAHDRNTRGHTERVRALALMIGEELGLAPHQLNRLHWAALVHDVGKLRVPAEILNKPGKPDEDEWAILKQHPEWGDEMVAPLRPWLGEYADATIQHHERWDGNGYPHGLKGSEITLAARIVAVADAYDVMTSVRSYKTAMDPVEARQELTRCAGTQFDPRCSRALISASLGASAKTKKGIVWAIRAPILTLTARSNLLANGATAATAVAATAAVVAVTVPPAAAPEPIAFVPDPVVEIVEFDVGIDRLNLIAGVSATIDVTINDQITATGRFGDPQLSTSLEQSWRPPEGVVVESDGPSVQVSATEDFAGRFEVPLTVCANELSCDDAPLAVSVVSTPTLQLVESLRIGAGEEFGPFPVIRTEGEVPIIGFQVDAVSDFFTESPSIDSDGQIRMTASLLSGLVVLSVTPQTDNGPLPAQYIYVLIEPDG